MNLIYLTLSALVVCAHGWRMQTPQFLQHEQYKWKVMEFGFPTIAHRQQAEANGNLEPTNAMLIDVETHYNNRNIPRTFVTIPRFSGGIPYTLATISKGRGANGPLLKPYPNYEMHNNRNGTYCEAITSALRMAVTECNQMWVIDSGMVGSDAQCPPQLLVFDLNTNRLVHRYQFDSSLYIPGASLFITPVVNVRDPKHNCIDTMVYVADVNYHGLVVYSLKEGNAWRIENKYMYPDPTDGLHSVAGESFVLMDGIFGMATDKENLYFHALASRKEYAVSLKVIDNSTIFENNSGNTYELFKPLGERSSPCAASAMDSNKNLYCVTMDPIQLLMWNVHTPYNKHYIKKLQIRPEELEFVSGMKVVKNNEGFEDLLMVSNRYQKMATGTRDFNEVNFRIVLRPLRDIEVLNVSPWIFPQNERYVNVNY